jgi:hypothetical protein
MTPNLQRCIQQARDYPNTATVDILAAAVTQETERLRHIVEAQDKALLHWRRAYDELISTHQTTVVKTEEHTCPSRPPS